MNKISQLLFELAAIAIIIGGTVFFHYSFCTAMKQIAPQKTTTHPTDSLPAKGKTDTTILTRYSPCWNKCSPKDIP